MRLRAQMLTGSPARSVEDVVGRLLAVQAQDGRGFRLAVRSRSSGLSALDVERALSERRTLVVAWLNRGTLHLVRASDYWWLRSLTAPRLTAGNARRLGQEGVSPLLADRGVTVIMDQLAAHGPRTRGELRVALDAAGVPTAGQALVHLLVAASLRHPVVRGPVRNGEHCFVDAPSWLGDPPTAVDRHEALAQLARRYLAGHGPASDRDLAAWSGLPVSDARLGLTAIADETRQYEPGVIDLVERDGSLGLPPPRLLGPFDPVMHGWADRSCIVADHAAVVTTNGLFRPVALVKGRAAGTWSLSAGVLMLKPLEPISDSVLKTLEQDARGVLDFLGLAPSALVVSPQ
jgi:hypothetical protein